MNIERSFMLGSESTRPHARYDLPPELAGLAAALRRAFDMPADETERQFAELLRKLH